MPSSVQIIDSKPQNPAFSNLLKNISKKERGFEEEIYREIVVPFLRCYCIKEKNALRPKSIGPVILLFEMETNDAILCRCIKFRIGFSNSGKSSGARLTAMVIPSKYLVIPLEIYTHSQRGKEAETEHPQLRSLFLKVWNSMSLIELKDAAD